MSKYKSKSTQAKDWLVKQNILPADWKDIPDGIFSIVAWNAYSHPFDDDYVVFLPNIRNKIVQIKPGAVQAMHPRARDRVEASIQNLIERIDLRISLMPSG